MRPRRLATFCLVAIAMAIATITAPSALGASEAAGEIRFVKVASSEFDRYTRDPSPAQQEWMRDHYWRMRGFSTYFDSRLSWAPPTRAYKNLYAIYADSDESQDLAEWILRDSQGRRLYIPYGCSQGSCPQYAADIGNPAFRDHWITEARTLLGRGYRGLFVDDVNMDMRVGDGSGEDVRPIDARTGEPMTDADWRRYIAEFTEEIRTAFPNAEIVHNAHWWAEKDDYVRRQLGSADSVELERGFNDAGIRGGGGKYGFETFLEHIDWLHAQGTGVLLESYADTASARDYGLACSFLVSSGRDAVSFHLQSTPDDWWPGYETDLGEPLGRPYKWKGLFRRDFKRGLVLVNQPDEPQRKVSLGGTYKQVGGRKRTSVTLGPSRGAILLRTSRG